MSGAPGHAPLLDAGPGAAADPVLLSADAPPCSRAELSSLLASLHAQVAPLRARTPLPVVLSLLPDHPASAVAVLGLAEHAAVAPVNPALTDAELAALAAALGAGWGLARADRPDDIARLRALGLPVIALQLPAGGHCAAFTLALPPEVPAPSRDAGAPASGLVLSTSGSTGSPKLVPLAPAQMRHSAGAIAGWLRLAPGDRALHMLPMFHVGAFVDLVLAPLGAGGSVRFAHPLTPERMAAAVALGDVTWAQAVPTMLTRLLTEDDPAFHAGAARLRLLRLVSSDLAPALQERAARLFPAAAIVQMYGMTETAGQIASNPLDAPRPGSVGLPAGAEITIRDAGGTALGPGETGEVCVAGPGVMAGYIGRPRGESFHGRWLRSGDLGHLDAEGYLFLTGRISETVNRGGEKIAPLEIEQAAMAHDDVLEAAAFGLAHPSLGAEPGLAVVARPGLDEAGLRAHLGARLAAFKLPRHIAFRATLPRLGSGKIDKRALAAELETAQATAAAHDTHDAPQDALARRIGAIWARVLATAPPGPEADFFDEGGDSLAATTFVVEVEKATGRAVPANLLFETPRFAALVAAVAALPAADAADATADADPTEARLRRALLRATAGWRGARARPDSLILSRRAEAPGVPLIFATPGLDYCEEMLSALSPGRPLYLARTLSALRGPLRRKLKTPANNARLAALLRDEIMALRPEGPLALGGFCQGAELARLLAAMLRAAGREVVLFIAIDRLFTEAVPGRAALVWTSGSGHSGLTQFTRPERHLGLLFPDGAEVLKLAEDHVAALSGASGRRIAAFIDAQIDAAAQSPNTARSADAADAAAMPSPALARLRRAHRARITARAPRLVVPGAPLAVRARVTNRSPERWEGGAEGGLSLYARWLNLDLCTRVQRAAHAPLPHALAPGESAELALSLAFPDKRLPMLLMLDMVQEGLNWFHWVGGRPCYRLVLPRGGGSAIASASGQR